LIIYLHSIFRPRQEPNLLVLHDSPQACIRKEFINEGVVRTDPESYVQRYGTELNAWQRNPQHSYLVGEASRAVPPPINSTSSYQHRSDYDNYCSNGYQHDSSAYKSSGTWDRAKVSSPIHRSLSYDSPYDYCTQSSSRYDTNRSYDDYCTQSSSRYAYDSHRSSDNYGTTRQGSYVTMADVTPAWERYCRSSSYGGGNYPSSHYPSSSSYSPQTIRVNSDNEFRRVLCDLTNGHVPSTLRSY
jgi:hypothetical protein